MFNPIRSLTRRLRSRQGAEPAVAAPDGVIRDDDVVDAEVIDFPVARARAAVPAIAEPRLPVQNIAPAALAVTWTPPAGAPSRKRLRRLDDAGMIDEAGRLGAKGFHRGDPMTVPGFASLWASTAADLTTAYLNDARVLGPQAAHQAAAAAVEVAQSELGHAQVRHGALVNNQPSIDDPDPQAQQGWVAGEAARRHIEAAESALAAAEAAHGVAERLVQVSATESARALGASAGVGASRLRRYHGAFNASRGAAGHEGLNSLATDLEEQLTVEVIRAARRAMNPDVNDDGEQPTADEG
jgi:hypothetical protein